MAYPLNGIFINSVLSTYCNKMVSGELRHAMDLMASSEHQPLVFDTYLYLKGFFIKGIIKPGHCGDLEPVHSVPRVSRAPVWPSLCTKRPWLFARCVY